MNTIRLFTRNVNKSCSVPSGKGTTIGTVSGPFLTGILVLVVAFTTNVFLLFAIVLARNRLVSPTDDIIDDTLLLRVAVVFVFVVVLAEDFDGDGDGVVGVGVRNISLSFLLFFFDFLDLSPKDGVFLLRE